MTDQIHGRWRWEINYGPEGEANYANVYTDKGDFVGNLRIYHAAAIVEACNAYAVIAAIAELRAALPGEEPNPNPPLPESL